MGKNFVLQKFEISSGSPTTPLFLAEDMSIWDLNTKCNIFKNMFFNEVRAIQAWNSCWFDKIHNIYVAQSWIYSTCTYDAVQSSCCCWICLGTLRVRTFITSFLSFFLSKARVDAPQRRGKTTEWETDFTHLSFERKMLMQHQLTNY